MDEDPRPFPGLIAPALIVGVCAAIGVGWIALTLAAAFAI